MEMGLSSQNLQCCTSERLMERIGSVKPNDQAGSTGVLPAGSKTATIYSKLLIRSSVNADFQ